MPRKPANLSRSINRQLNMYALAAASAGVSALALAQPAEAKIVYTPGHVKLTANHPFPLDLNHDGIVDFFLLPFESEYRYYTSTLFVCHVIRTYSGNRNFCSSSNKNPENGIRPSKGQWGAALRPGAKIQGRDKFLVAGSVALGRVKHHGFGSTATTQWYGPWMNGGKGVKDRYLGIRFAIKGQLHFGWARMTITRIRESHGRYDFAATLTGYAYETVPGKAIVAGQTKSSDDVVERPGAALTTPTPEPATLGMLALGAQGVVWRRKEPALSPLSP